MATRLMEGELTPAEMVKTRRVNLKREKTNESDRGGFSDSRWILVEH